MKETNKMPFGIILRTCFLLIFFVINGNAQSVAKIWNQALIESIRHDFARPPVHARNLFHISAAAYDAWAVFDDEADTYFLGKTVGGYTIPFNGFTPGPDIEAQRREAISFAMYRMLIQRFKFSPEGIAARDRFNAIMLQLGYDKNFTSKDYSTGSAAALGNYIADRILNYGLQDGARELQNYNNAYYQPINDPLVVVNPGNPTITDPNRWQPLTLGMFVDQSGNPIPGNTPPFLGPEWGNVVPFALTNSDKTSFVRDGNTYNVYLDPGDPPYIDTNSVVASKAYKWNFGLVAQWSSHLDPNDGVNIDISPASIGNISTLPDPDMYDQFYNYIDGGDASMGWTVNPKTGQPYTPQIVPRGDYGRVLAEFWADGPNSETPPGHWFAIVNEIGYKPEMSKKIKGLGADLDSLEWDVKLYFMLGSAMHDAAITAWGIKGWYDYIRPISAIRYMAQKGQCTDPNLPSYHPAGLDLIDGYVEVVQNGDPLAGPFNENVGKIKIFAWRGRAYIPDPLVDDAGVGWILAENWEPYQLPTFVTPPFAGYISGHSTYSRAAAEILTMFTGDEFFPGGLGEFHMTNHHFLKFESGPSIDMTLQWATYRDASDQTSLSRIWGGIHPPADDIPGRKKGIIIAEKVFNKSLDLFYDDADGDGFYSFEDCNDNNPNINKDAGDICDGIDNNCDGIVDGTIDQDHDGIGNECDLDDDNDGVKDTEDLCNFSKPGSSVDLHGCTDIDGDLFFTDVDSLDSRYDPNDGDSCIPSNSAAVCDADGDGLTNYQERIGLDNIPDSGDETDMFLKDTDGDNYDDGVEVLTLHTNPLDRCDPDPLYPECNTPIGGIVWVDNNYDGQYQIGEQLLRSIKVRLYRRIPTSIEGIPILETITDINGHYEFALVDTGSYYVVFEQPDGYGQTLADLGSDLTDSDLTNGIRKGSSDVIYINGTPNVNAISAGFYECNTIGDLVWYDINKNDVANPTENGINGLKVDLYRFTNGAYQFFARTYTGQKPGSPSDDGYFAFCAPQGQYFIKIEMPPVGLVLVKPNVGNNEELDSDITESNGEGTSDVFFIQNGVDKTDLGAGYYPMARIGHRVWFDQNANGLQDDNEVGVPNVLVEVFNGTGEKVSETVSDENGNYEVEYLRKNAYFLKFSPENGYYLTLSHMGDENMDSDIDHSNGVNTTAMYMLQPEMDLPNIDAGIVASALPLKWMNISAIAHESTNEIKWATTNEVNVSHYSIERSIDGIRFEEMGEVLAKEAIGLVSEYSYYDERPVNMDSYYRVKGVDIDGNVNYSKQVMIKGRPTSFVISPNPSNGHVKISTQSKDIDDHRIKITDVQGRLITQMISSFDDRGLIEYNVDGLTQGVYFVEYEFGANKIVKKLIVVN